MKGSFLAYEKGIIRWDCIRNIVIEEGYEDEWYVQAHLGEDSCYTLGTYSTLEGAQELLLKIIEGLRGPQPQETQCGDS